jgi:hypothetical protein
VPAQPRRMLSQPLPNEIHLPTSGPKAPPPRPLPLFHPKPRLRPLLPAGNRPVPAQPRRMPSQPLPNEIHLPTSGPKAPPPRPLPLFHPKPRLRPLLPVGNRPAPAQPRRMPSQLLPNEMQLPTSEPKAPPPRPLSLFHPKPRLRPLLPAGNRPVPAQPRETSRWPLPGELRLLRPKEPPTRPLPPAQPCCPTAPCHRNRKTRTQRRGQRMPRRLETPAPRRRVPVCPAKISRIRLALKRPWRRTIPDPRKRCDPRPSPPAAARPKTRPSNPPRQPAKHRR